MVPFKFNRTKQEIAFSKSPKLKQKAIIHYKNLKIIRDIPLPQIIRLKIYWQWVHSYRISIRYLIIKNQANWEIKLHQPKPKTDTFVLQTQVDLVRLLFKLDLIRLLFLNLKLLNIIISL